MSLITLDAALVEAIHNEVLNAGLLPGRARDKSLDRALMQVENRIACEMIEDVYDLAATYAVTVATGHCFNDANKQTAFRTMNPALRLSSERIAWTVEEVGPLIIEVAYGKVDEAMLAG